MEFEFLKPVSDTMLAHCELLADQHLGSHLVKHTEKGGMPDLDQIDMALVVVHEHRSAEGKRSPSFDSEALRLAFYQLFYGNWSLKIADLGDLQSGNQPEDTQFALKQLVAELLAKGVMPLVIGAIQDSTYGCYRGFDSSAELLHLGLIDSRFDLCVADEMVSGDSYVSKMITEAPNQLYHLTQIGYQSYFVAQEELDLYNQLFFEAYRLGDLTPDMRRAEPLLRTVNLLSVDLHAVAAAELAGPGGYSPNGFSGREICALMRYAGIADQLRLLGIFEVPNTGAAQLLCAQMLWYFIEGYTLRINEIPDTSSEDFVKFNVPIDNDNLVFYKSLCTDRWWVEVAKGDFEKVARSDDRPYLVPCLANDYQTALSNELPDCWIRASRRSMQ